MVGLVARKIAKEGALGNATTAIVDCGVGERPVNRKTERSEQFLERLFIFRSEGRAQFDEISTTDLSWEFLLLILRAVGHRDGRGEVRVVGKRWVALDPVVVLHTAFGGQTVVVPTHWVEHGLAPHALVTSDGVGVGVTEDMADVK